MIRRVCAQCLSGTGGKKPGVPDNAPCCTVASLRQGQGWPRVACSPRKRVTMRSMKLLPHMITIPILCASMLGVTAAQSPRATTVTIALPAMTVPNGGFAVDDHHLVYTLPDPLIHANNPNAPFTNFTTRVFAVDLVAGSRLVATTPLYWLVSPSVGNRDALTLAHRASHEHDRCAAHPGLSQGFGPSHSLFRSSRDTSAISAHVARRACMILRRMSAFQPRHVHSYASSISGDVKSL